MKLRHGLWPSSSFVPISNAFTPTPMKTQSYVTLPHVSPYPTSDANGWKLALELEFGFNISAIHNSKVDELYDPSSQGLFEVWAAKKVFLNLIDSDDPAPHLARAYSSARLSRALVVSFVRRQFQTEWWQNFAAKASEVRMPCGRLEHGVHRNGSSLEVAILIFRPRS